MTSIILSQSTQDKINFAISAGPGANNQNYLAAYNAVNSEISANGGFDAGTANWFSKAGQINTQAFNSSAVGTYVWNYTIAAARAEGTTLTAGDMQAASNKIAETVFGQLRDSGFHFSDNPSDQINFAPRSIVQIDAVAGINELSALHPGSDLSAAVWAGSLFARTQFNDPTYFTDNNIDLTPGSRDCAAITSGSVAAVNASTLSLGTNWVTEIVVNGFVQGTVNYYRDVMAAIGSQDNAAIKACFPGGQQGSFGSGSSKLTLDNNGD